MQNSWNDVSGTTGGAKQQTPRKEPIDSVIDAFKDIVPADAILSSGWQTFEKKKGGHAKSSEVASRSSWGDAISATSNQEESEKSWSSWGNSGNSSSWGNSSGWGNEDNNVRNYSTNNQNSAYEEYQDVNKVTDAIRPNLAYSDSREGYQDVNKTTDAGRPNQINNFDMYTNNDNYNDQSEWSERPQSPQQQQQHSYAEPPSPSESDTSTDRNSETIDPTDIKTKLSAWHSLASSDFKEREDGIGGGQLHRRGKNFIPLDEATVLAIQQKGGSNKKSIRKIIEKSIPSKTKNILQGQIGKPPAKPPQKPVTPLKQSYPKNPYIPNTDTSQKSPAQKASNTKVPAKTTVSQNQRQNTQPIHPNRTQQQTQQKPPSQSSQSSQSQPPWGVPKQPLRERSQQSQQLQQSQQPTQKSQQPQKSQQQSQKHSWDNPQLVNEPFWEMPNSSPTVQNQSQSNTSSRQYANEVIANQSQPLRQQSPPIQQQSPTRSPRPTKPVYDSLPYIPPEFDSTPYRNQTSPSPVCDVPNGYNKSVTNEWGDNKVYEQDYGIDDQRNEYYDDSDIEEQENRFSDYNDRHKESEKNQTPRVIRRDRGQLLLTINVELEEGKTQAIEVHVNDEPLDLAKDFCDSWKVTNPVVMPALECLIREEKEKRLGV